MKKAMIFLLSITLLFSLALPISAKEGYTKVMDVLDVNFNKASTITIDGKMEDGEWGEPVYTVTPLEVMKNQNFGWEYRNPNGMPDGQRVEIYVTNSTDYVFIGCKLIGANYDAGSDSNKRTDVEAHAHFGFTLSYYTPNTVVHQGTYQGEKYEHYTHYVFATVEGKKWSGSNSQGYTIVPMEEKNYDLSYDRATRTYTYEIRVPLTIVELDFSKTYDAVMSFDIGDANGENGANRYLISRAAEKAWATMGPYTFAHGKTYPLVVTLLQAKDIEGVSEFVATDKDLAWVGAMNQSGVIHYEDVARAQDGLSSLRAIDIIAMAVALVVLAVGIALWIIRKKRS